MDTRQSDNRHQAVLTHSGPAEPQIVRRAVHLCLRSEPHTEEAPCSGHLYEAQRQLDRRQA
ncbi:MAG: hypothetical protein QOJ69_250 [Actinomycetota bacterium]|jgi:hypothetical protein|nr:hypothetical protein [Actinomycetota bacterium]MEA2842579.1 hypothetical protein [Actinomycetota bacterium]